MKKSPPYDSSKPQAGEMSSSRRFDDIPPAEILQDFEENGEESEWSDLAYFTVVDEEPARPSRAMKPRVADSSPSLSGARARGTSFTPRPNGPERTVHDGTASAAPYHSIGSDPFFGEMPFGLPPLPVLAVAVLLLLLALWG
jgi:hypothetical protein